jgi:ElaB/YqjD/DUF883 family membrane-anchored ribosome-binding protein
MTIEQQLRQAIADEKESFKKYHAKHQSRLNQLKSKLKHERNNIRTVQEAVAFGVENQTLSR